MSKQTISTITDRVIEGMAEWQSRPLDSVYPVIFIDAVNVKIRDGNVANRPIYIALAVTVEGTRDILGLWAGEHGDGEGAKFWARVLSEIKNRGTQDVCMVVCDGLKGLPAAIETVWPQAIPRHASCTCSATASATPPRSTGRPLPGNHQTVGVRMAGVRPIPAVRHPHSHRDLHDECHRIHQRADPQGGQRPRPLSTETAALKCVYLAIMSLDPTGRGRQRWSNRWKEALNAFEITFDGRLSAGRK